MRALVPLTFTLAFLAACTPSAPQEGAPGHDADWIGELRILPGDTTVLLCGSGQRYRLTGPALDTLAAGYAHRRERPGQWMKVWFRGHVDTLAGVLTGTAYQHLDATMHCDPRPDSAVAGSYTVVLNDPTGPRSIHLALFPAGDVTMTTKHLGRMVEEDGRWGLDSDGRVAVEWPQREQTMHYRYADGTLVAEIPSVHRSLTLRRDGPADRSQGIFGRCARWMATLATATGHPVDPATLTPETPLATLFPTPEAKAALRASARDTLGFDDQRLRLEWDAVDNLRTVTALLRLRVYEEQRH